ncbi:MAG: transporter [Candidatus Latescibacteria bacterium]|nr:transporter [Candidatus Latescibacterota bacterium]
MKKSKLLKNGSEIPDPLDREVRVVAIPLMFPYELIPNRLVVGAGVPYLDKALHLNRDGAKQTLSDQGFGDLSLLAKYQLLQRDAPHRTTRLTFKGGLKLPTGDHRETDGEGNPLPRGLQLGTGSVDYSAGLIFTHSTGRLGINADAVYWFNKEADGFEFGDALNYDLAVGYRIHPSVYQTYPSPYATVYLEANGQFGWKDRAGRQIAADSGGHTLFLSPGIQYVPFRSLALEASVQIPVLQDLNGTQLGTNLVFKTGIQWLVF